MFFNMTLIIGGIQYSILDTLGYREQQIFMFCLFYGDIGHFYWTYHYILSHSATSKGMISTIIHEWPIGVHLNLIITFALMCSRILWWIGGKRYDLQYAGGGKSRSRSGSGGEKKKK